MNTLLKVLSVDVPSWLFEGEWVEDTQYHNEVYYVVATCADGGKYVHQITFVDNPEGANTLAQRVLDRGVIDMQHWGFHEFFSLSLEQRFAAEAYHENLHRNNMGHLSNGCYSGGHV